MPVVQRTDAGTSRPSAEASLPVRGKSNGAVRSPDIAVNTASAYGEGHGERRRSVRSREKAYAAIDLGTNNCRLLIAAPVGKGFRVIDAFSRIVRLGEGLSQAGVLSDEAQERAVGALAICAQKIQRRGVRLTRNVATEACRQARNTQQFVERVFAETGLALDVISPSEEARLAALGCLSLLDRSARFGLIFDIGGGSTEFVLVDRHDPANRDYAAWTSVRWGVTSLHETFAAGTSVSAESFQAMKNTIMADLAPFKAQMEALMPPGAGLQLLGTSGTVTTLASLYLGLPEYDRKQVDGCRVPSPDMLRISGSLKTLDLEQRIATPGIGRERADLVVAGCAILEAILEMWPVAEMRIADRGIREGVLRSLMERDGVLIAG